MSIQRQADFWYRNVCDVSAAAKEFIKKSVVDSEELLDGLAEYAELLRNIYKNYTAFEVSKVESQMTKIGILADDLDNYHNLTNTGACLFGLAKSGELRREEVVSYLRINKALFRTYFKKPPAFYFDLLQQYGFYYMFYKNEKQVKTVGSSDTIDLYYEGRGSGSVLYAMKYLSDYVAEKDSKDVILPTLTAFLFADCDSLLLDINTNNKPMYTLPQTVLNCVGNKRELLSELVSRYCGESKLNIHLVINTYVFPNWTIKFKLQKKTISTFHAEADNICIHLPVSYDVGKLVIDKKDELSPNIRDCLNHFGCAGCGKCQGQRNMDNYKGYHLCSLPFSNFTTEYARLIRTDVSSEDLNSICSIMDALLAEKQ